MKLKLFLFLGLIFFLINSCDKAVKSTKNTCVNVIDSSSKHPKHLLFTQLLNKYQKLGLPGISVLIEDEDGVWVGSAGYSDIANSIKFQPCTVSKVASITKMMFATAVMQLREQGLLNLEDKISKWLDKDILKNIENAEQFTIKDLMQHSTGIYDIITDSDFYLSVLNNPNKKWSGEELIKFAYQKTPMFTYKPNANKGAYSNSNTLLLSMCVDKIIGKSHHHAMRELVINKVGMNNTFYHHHEDLPNYTAQGYYDLYNNGTITNVSNLITGSGNGYGGIYSNVFDLHKFIKALFIDKTLVNQASFDMMNTFIEDDENGDLGVGILRQAKKNPNGHFKVGHSGRDLGYSGDAHYFPTKNNRILIYLVNYGTNGKTALRDVYYNMRDEFALELTKY